MTGLVVAPVLFKHYERLVAGDIAGRLFTAVSWLGLLCGALLLILATVRARQQLWRDWRAGIVVAMLIITVIGEFVLAVRLRELMALRILPSVAPEILMEFGRLHGVASLLFLTNSVLGLALVMSGIRPRAQAGS